MPRKPKFRPRITRVKLNPEQAVLVCRCYDVGGYAIAGNEMFSYGPRCVPWKKSYLYRYEYAWSSSTSS